MLLAFPPNLVNMIMNSLSWLLIFFLILFLTIFSWCELTFFYLIHKSNNRISSKKYQYKCSILFSLDIKVCPCHAQCNAIKQNNNKKKFSLEKKTHKSRIIYADSDSQTQTVHKRKHKQVRRVKRRQSAREKTHSDRFRIRRTNLLLALFFLARELYLLTRVLVVQQMFQ